MNGTERFADALSEEGRYRLLVDAVTDYAIYMLDPGGHVASWNAGAERIKGFSRAEILGQHFSRFYTDEDRAAGLPQRVLETAAREGRFEGEGWRVRKDGTRFWAHVIVDPIPLPDGQLVGYAKVTRDLTERQATKEALRRSEERFQLLVRSVTDYAIYMLDHEGRVTSWNAGAQRIKGYTADEITGEHFSRFYTPEDRAAGEPQRALDMAIRDGRYEREGQRVRKDGTRFWANAVIEPIRDERGEIVAFAKVTRDVTERREQQQRLEQAREALFQSQKMDAIGQLTGGVAHDFNNLLMAVLGSLELVKKRLPDDPRITPLLDNAIQGAQRGSALTQRMLAFARRQELKPVAIDLGTLMGSMTELLQRSLGPSIDIETHLPDGLPPVLADSNQLELAILNLAVNARDAMPDGGRIAIGGRADTVGAGNAFGLPPGGYVCLSVTDTGEGMDPETLSRAMEPFFTTKGIGKGTGLGLSMVHGMTEQSGGRFVLTSTPGQGTTAEIWLPAAPSEHAVGGDTAPRSDRRREVRPLTVLAVDDDALVLMNTIAMLEELGHTVIEAHSGAAALKALTAGYPIDLLITDQAMPQMTGVQLIDAATAQRPDLAVVLATGYAELPAGAAANLPRLGKPFGQGELARAIAEAVELKRRHEAAGH